MRSELERSDAKVHRCGGCGTWRFGYNPCTTPGCYSKGFHHATEPAVEQGETQAA